MKVLSIQETPSLFKPRPVFLDKMNKNIASRLSLERETERKWYDSYLEYANAIK